MSAFRNLNMSEYLRNLNRQEPVEDVDESTYVNDDDLAVFTNTHFYDYETGQNTDYQAAPVKPDAAAPLTVTTNDAAPADPLLAADFSAGLDFGEHSFFIFILSFPSFGLAPSPHSLPSSLLPFSKCSVAQWSRRKSSRHWKIAPIWGKEASASSTVHSSNWHSSEHNTTKSLASCEHSVCLPAGHF